MFNISRTAFFIWFSCLGIAGAETLLTVDKVREMALQYNRQYLAAVQELDRAHGTIISARAGALPQLSLSGRYTRNLTERSLFFAGEQIPISLNNEFAATISLTQPLYVGGKVGSALAIAKVYERYSHEKLRQSEVEVIYNGEVAFYGAALAQSALEVLQKAFDQLTYNLDVVQKYYKQGMNSEYDLLRAKVEKANLEPQLIGAQSNAIIAKKRLKSYIGLPLDDSVSVVTDLTDTAYTPEPPMDSLMAYALINRPEIKQAEYLTRITNKAIRIARGSWLYPVVSLNTTYDVSGTSDNFKLGRQDVAKSWSASLLVNVPLFDGGSTIGEVRKANVDYHEAVLAEQQSYDNVRLEVEQAYDNLTMARKSMEIQKETSAQAEEGMRISNLRYQSGIGTQLEVLSAQTALTTARTNLISAIYNYRLAKSALKKASGFDIK